MRQCRQSDVGQMLVDFPFPYADGLGNLLAVISLSFKRRKIFWRMVWERLPLFMITL